jgi:hypothetical protein
MAYHSWIEFRKQWKAVRVAGGLPALRLAYQNWTPPPTHWNAFTDFDPIYNAKVTHLTGWQPGAANVIQIPIQPPAMRPDLLEAIEHFGAVLQNAKNVAQPKLQGSARGAVIYDVARDKLYYAVSRSSVNLNIHPTLIGRQQQILAVPGQNNGSLTGWASHACAEFRALNLALFDGAHEGDLEVWTFRAKNMEPTPRCRNCEYTVPWGALCRICTC